MGDLRDSQYLGRRRADQSLQGDLYQRVQDRYPGLFKSLRPVSSADYKPGQSVRGRVDPGVCDRLKCLNCLRAGELQLVNELPQPDSPLATERVFGNGQSHFGYHLVQFIDSMLKLCYLRGFLVV